MKSPRKVHFEDWQRTGTTLTSRLKGQVSLVHVRKAYRVSTGTAPQILDLGTIWI
jgi:hypothetical protein